MPPAVIDVLSQFRRDLAASDVATMRRMASRWAQVERALESDTNLAAQALSQLRIDGWAVTPALAMRQQRVQTLLAQTRAQVDKYASWADGTIARRQRSALADGIDAGSEAIRATAGAALQFDKLPVAAIENLVGLAGDGSPLVDTLRNTYGDGANGILDNLINGVARGKGPAAIARQALREGLSQSLNHMMTVARTETNRVHREASLETYRHSGVVQGYYRVCAKSTRSCLGCLMSDGQFFLLDVPFDEHVLGRCVPRPAIIGAPDLQVENGAQWFERQSDETKLKMLGPQRMELYQRGVPFRQFGVRRENATWGGSYVPATISEVLGGPRGPAPRWGVGMGAPPKVTEAELARKRILEVARRPDIDPDAQQFSQLQARIRAINARQQELEAQGWGRSPDFEERRQEFNKLTFEKFDVEKALKPLEAAGQKRELARAAEYRKLLRVDNPTSITVETTQKKTPKAWTSAMKEVSQMIDASVVPPGSIRMEPTRGRGYFSRGILYVTKSADKTESLTAHELGHWMESRVPGVNDKANAFLDRRTLGEPLRHMGPGYGADEYTRRDKFISPYMGKKYAGTTDTEITSMALEYMYKDAAKLAREDPEMFDFIYNLLRGNP